MYLSIGVLCLILNVCGNHRHVVGVQNFDVGGPIQSWTLSDVSLSVAAHGKYVSYDESYKPDTIWIFGGRDSSCPTCVEYYNITDDTITSYDTLHTGTQTWGRPGSAQIGGLVYYLSKTGEIHTYEIDDKQQSTTALATIPDGDNDGCLTKDPNNDNELYILSGQTTNTFYIYNIENGNLTHGASLTYNRFQPTCAVSNWENDAYLYVILGRSSHIERINLNTLLKWETLLLRFDDDYIQLSDYNLDSGEGRLPAVVSFANYIYIIGGYVASNTDTDQIYYLDVANWELKLAGTFPVARYGISGIYIEKTKQIYTFGGYESGVAPDGSIYFSNKAYFLPTVEPTSIPTETPTASPTTFVTTGGDTTGTDTTTTEEAITTSRATTEMTSLAPSSAPSQPIESVGETTMNPIVTQELTSNAQPSGGPTVEPSENGEYLESNNNSNGNEIEDLTIVIIALSGVISVCCIVALCIFCLSMGYCYKKEHRYNTIHANNVNTYQMRAMGNNNNYNNNNNNNHVMEMANQNRIHAGALDGTQIIYSNTCVINGENASGMPALDKVKSNSAMGNSVIVNNGIAKNNHNNHNDDELYMSPVNQRGNNNNNYNASDNGGQVAQINVDGKNVEIKYQDLVNILNVNQENENEDGNDTTQIAGEKVAEIEDE